MFNGLFEVFAEYFDSRGVSILKEVLGAICAIMESLGVLIRASWLKCRGYVQAASR